MLVIHALLACLALLAGGRGAATHCNCPPPRRCSTPVEFGNTAARPVKLEEIPLQPPSAMDYNFTLPDACYPSAQVGATAAACGRGAKPSLELINQFTGRAHRLASSTWPLFVDATVYCYP